jgi:ribosomal protein L37AE/L43A
MKHSVESVTEDKSQRFCTNCQAMRDSSTGQLRRLRTTSRWICQACLERKAKSIYASKSNRSSDISRLIDMINNKVAS